jgi:hypothetical protein
MRSNSVAFSLVGQAAWAPGIAGPADWAAWADAPWTIHADTAAPGAAAPGDQAPVDAMPAMLRRRAGTLGKMALQAAYDCLGERSGVATVFCSRHGEVARAVDLIAAMVQGEGVSPTGFGLSVHNASAGLFSIARAERASHGALAGGAATVEQGVIEACGLLADGEKMVLLVAYDAPLPAMLRHFEDCNEQPFAFAWAMVAADAQALRLSWEREDNPQPDPLPGGLAALRFQLSGAAHMRRSAEGRSWTWSRDA